MNNLSSGTARRVCFADLFASFPAMSTRRRGTLIAAGVFALLLLGAITTPAQAQQVAFTGAQTTVPASGLLCPRGVAVDRTGNVFVADSNDSRIIEAPAGGPAEFTVGTGMNGPMG